MSDKNIYLARQPIFDTVGTCFAYEILYRQNKNSIKATVANSTVATAHVMINLMNNIGFSSIIEDKICFVNIDEEILLNDTLLSLPKEKFIFEILESVKINKAVIERVTHLQKIGYRFALDDFRCTHENIEYVQDIFPFIEVLKIDLLENHDMTIEEIALFFKPYQFKLLAEKVETTNIFERCKNAGFDMYQGFFFEKPTIIKGKKIEPNVVNTIEIINIMHTTDDLKIITDKFSLYPEVTFNLLRYINSAEFSFCSEIASIRQIINLLGPLRLRSWLGLFLYTNNTSKVFGESIIKSAKFRANMMKELVIAHKKKEYSNEAFLTGSLSLIDVYLEVNMEELTNKILLSKSIEDALLSREGYLGKILSITEQLERTNNLQNMIEVLGVKLNIKPDILYALYCKANGFAIPKND